MSNITIKIENFLLHNVIDTCSINNLISSKKLFNSSILCKCVFIVTDSVYFECLLKPWKKNKNNKTELQKRIQEAFSSLRFEKHQISLDDLFNPEMMNLLNHLGKGEVSSIILAKKYQIAFLTDDQKARKYAEDILGKEKVQTVPHLSGWMFFKRVLIDSDLQEIITEHNQIIISGRLNKYIEDAYHAAMIAMLGKTN